MQTTTTPSSRRRPSRQPRPLVSYWRSGYGLHFCGIAEGDLFATGCGFSPSEAEFKARLKFDRAREKEQTR